MDFSYRLAAALVLGSGIINILSAAGKAIPFRLKLLLDIFPIEFIRLTHFLVLIIGIALTITAINLFKAKRRAYQLALGLTSLAVVFHLTKGLDVEEALLSAFVALLLWLNRRRFTVESAPLNWRSSLTNGVLVLILTFAYGVAGFWLLDKSDFGRNFSVADSFRETGKEMFFVTTPELKPHSRHARFFLDSLNLSVILAWAFGLLNLFGPAAYFWLENSLQKQRVEKIIAKENRTSLDYFKLWPQKSWFFNSNHQAVIAYGVANGVAVALGDPVGPADLIDSTISEFKHFCRSHGWKLAFLQTPPDYLKYYRRLKFRVFRIGDDAIVDLERFSLEGKEAKKKRYQFNKLTKLGFSCKLLPAPLSLLTLRRLKLISDDWLKIKGRRERGFSQGYFDETYLKHTACLVVKDQNKRWLAFVNLLPTKPPQEATIDLMRHRRQILPETMDFLFINLFLQLKQRGFSRFNLGLSPMSGEKPLHRMMQSTNFLFSFKGLKAYKNKYADSWEPRYLIYQSWLDLPRIAQAINNLSQVK